MICKCAPTPFYSFPHYLAGGGCREMLRGLARVGERGGVLVAGPQYHQCPLCGSVVPLDSSRLRADQFPRERATLGSGEMQHFPDSHSGDTASPTGDSEAGPSALSPSHYQRAEAVVRTHLTATFAFGPHHIDRGQWSLVMGARLFLETQGTVWWGVERRDNETFRPSCTPCTSLQVLKHIQAPLSSTLPSSQLPLCLSSR